MKKKDTAPSAAGKAREENAAIAYSKSFDEYELARCNKQVIRLR